MSDFWVNMVFTVGGGVVYHFAYCKSQLDHLREQVADLKVKSESADKLITAFTVKLENIEKTLEKIDRKLER